MCSSDLAVGLSHLLEVFARAGREQSGSAEYRGTILVLVSRLRFLGASPAAVNRGGTTKWAGFNSIDNEVLLAALRFGWAPVALFLVGLAVVVGRVLVRRGMLCPELNGKNMVSIPLDVEEEVTIRAKIFIVD